MKFQALFSLTVGLTMMQMASLASASPSNRVFAQSVGSVQGSGGTADMTLNKARWSLPSCGVMKPIEAPHSAVTDDEDFPTPASVAAEEKGQKKVVKAKTPSAPAVADTEQAPPVVSPSAPFVRLTLTPQAEQLDQAKTPSIVKAPTVVKVPTFAKAPKAPAAPQTTISNRTVGSPIPGPSSYVPAFTATSTAVKMTPSSSVSNTPQSTSAPMPGSGAPMPGMTPVGSPPGTTVRPSKTAAKGNTQANADINLKIPQA